MKKILTFVLALLFAVSLADAQDGWVTHKADNRISIKFPSEPRELTPGSFIATNTDNSIAYVFTMVDLVQAAGIDSVALAPIKATPEFAGQLKVGLKQSLPDVDLSDFTIGNWKGFTSYTGTGTDSKKKKYDIFMIIIGNKLYSISTVINEGVDAKSKDQFFNSLQLSN
ncbi:MAG: hypothetical protein ACXVB0_20565 [Mucilaginibacter sp.]